MTQRIVDEGERVARAPEPLHQLPARPCRRSLVDLDRAKAKTLGVRVDEVFETLQVFMGGLYVNDFDRFGRLFRVYAQAEGDLRAQPEDVQRLWVRSERGEMVPLSTLLSLERIAGPRDIPHYNVYRAAKIQGEAAPGYSSGPGARPHGGDRARGAAARRCPSSGPAPPTRSARRAARRSIILALSLLVVFLFLAAQYESWSLPFAIMLVVPLAFLGALGAQALRGLANDLYCQIGLVTLIGLATQELDPDRRVREAPARGGRQPRRRRARGRGDPLPAGADDGVRVHPRRGAARDRDRRGRRRAALARHGGVRRHARRDAAHRSCWCRRST